MRHTPSDAWERLRGIQPLSLCDWPGRSTAVLFLSGCNLGCPTCHNADLAWRPESLPTIFAPDALHFIERRRDWLDGIVVSGGEPTIADGLCGFLGDIGRFGLPVKLDTNGMRPDVLADVLDRELVEEIHVDVKGPVDLYPALTGGKADAKIAAENLSQVFDLARERPKSFAFRMTRVPLLSPSDIDAARALLPAGFSLTVNAYVPPRRTHAHADPQTRRMPGNLVHGAHRRCHPESPESQRNQGPDPRPQARP